MTTQRKWRVLFVDDDPSILAGFKMVFHRDRKEWDVAFAQGGDQALELMRASCFDVIVSDMRMPTLDGAELLALVQEQWPETFRIILSGTAETESMLRAMPATHVILGKPCEPDMLRATIGRCRRVAGATGDAAVRTLVGRIDKLPSPPRTYLELTKLVESPKASIDDVAGVVVRDTALAAKVMQFASSAAFSGAGSAPSLRAAVQMLGFDLLKAIALTSSLFAPGKQPQAATLERLQVIALKAAALARQIAPPRIRDLAFVAALLHDIGHVVLAIGRSDDYATLCATTGDEPMQDVERRIFGVDHAQLGAYLLGMWGLPTEIVEAIACHHAPREASAEARSLAAVVHAAVALTALDVQLDQEWLESCGFGADIERWRSLAGAAS
jgi:putative nucleotidyltransferase with HDIG domain